MPDTLTNDVNVIDLVIRQGGTFYEWFQLFEDDAETTPQDITGNTYAAQIRRNDGTLLVSFTCTVLDAALGKVAFSLTPSQTSALPLGSGFVWDMEETSGSVVNPLFGGRVTVRKQVTL